MNNFFTLIRAHTFQTQSLLETSRLPFRLTTFQPTTFQSKTKFQDVGSMTFRLTTTFYDVEATIFRSMPMFFYLTTFQSTMTTFYDVSLTTFRSTFYYLMNRLDRVGELQWPWNPENPNFFIETSNLTFFRFLFVKSKKLNRCLNAKKENLKNNGVMPWRGIDDCDAWNSSRRILRST